MTVLGLVFLGAALVALVWRRRMFPFVLAASAALPASAAFTVAGNSVSPFYAMSAIAALLLVFDKRRIASGRGRLALAVFVAWSLMITLLGPILFAGTRVLSARIGIDIAVLSPDQLAFTASSIAQASYLFLGVCAIVYLARSQAHPLIAGLPLAIATVLTSLRALTLIIGVRWPAELFDTSVNVLYSDTSDGTGSRLRGIFTEPSELAGFSLAAVAFFAVAAFTQRGLIRWSAIALTSTALVNLNLSSSGTATIGIVIFGAIALTALLAHTLRTDAKTLPYIAIGMLLAAVGIILFGSTISERGLELFTGKVGSMSFFSRTTADLFSLSLAGQTAGMGVGLGANRPSSFLTMLLSCVGVIGLIAFAALVFQLLRGALRTPAALTSAWALLALLVAKAVSLPDLSTPVLWILIGACSASQWRLATVPVTPKLRSNMWHANILSS
jgi:hypothetical protein